MNDIRGNVSTSADVLILLPPSETKRDGGTGPELSLEDLSFSPLTAIRDRLISSLERLSTSVDRTAKWLEISGVLAEIEAGKNADLRSSPTMPALDRYTGVLFDAIDVQSMTAAERRRAGDRVLIASALFGVLRADDLIPTYRLSGGNRLPRVGGLPALWRPKLLPVLTDLAEQQLMVDLRSGAYSALAPNLDAVTVNVLSERPDGGRSVVSHANKHTKGLLARMLIAAPKAPVTAEEVADQAEQAGFRVELDGSSHINVILTT